MKTDMSVSRAMLLLGLLLVAAMLLTNTVEALPGLATLENAFCKGLPSVSTCQQCFNRGCDGEFNDWDDLLHCLADVPFTTAVDYTAIFCAKR